MIEQFKADVTARFGAAVIDAAKAHARAEFPKESCGFVVAGNYVACENKSDEPTKHFVIEDELFDEAMLAGKVDAIVHSHPGGQIFPSEHDMRQQMATNVPWAIIPLNDTSFGDITCWGDDLPVAPLVGRPFVHGIFDCYSLVRDVFRLGGETLSKEGIVWPGKPVELPEVPRADNWWQSGADLYIDYLEPQGFKPISMSEARPGDGFLISLGDSRANPKKRLNHAGLLLGDGMILHHLPTRLSRREPAGLWGRAADLWVRNERLFQ